MSDKDPAAVLEDAKAWWSTAIIDMKPGIIRFAGFPIEQLIGAVSFRKGCYTGQEIVARTQYRGILKKRMAIAHVDGTTPTPGQSVYSAAFGEQSAGTVANVAPAPEGGYDFLVVAQIEGLREGNLRLGSPDGAPIAIRSHPPLDAAPR